MKKPKVSIIIPTYNHERFIGDCLDSVVKQSYPFWEAIVIDDGSTDHTPFIIKRYSDKRIRFYHQKNKGIWKLKESYNKALKLSRGDLIAILEGDDFWPPYKLERQIQDFLDKDVVLSYGLSGITDSKANLIRVFPKMLFQENFAKIAQNFPPGEAIKQIAWENFIVPVTVLIKKSSLISIGGFHGSKNLPVVDIPTFLRLSLLGKFAFHKEILGFWRQHFAQATKKITPTLIFGEFGILEEFFQEHSELPKKLGLSQAELKKHYKNKIFDGYYVAGRAKLADGNFKAANEDFKKVIISSSAKSSTKSKALLGLLFSFLKIDLEGLAKILGKPSYK